jgi:hypothetical protein
MFRTFHVCTTKEYEPESIATSDVPGRPLKPSGGSIAGGLLWQRQRAALGFAGAVCDREHAKLCHYEKHPLAWQQVLACCCCIRLTCPDHNLPPLVNPWSTPPNPPQAMAMELPVISTNW